MAIFLEIQKKPMSSFLADMTSVLKSAVEPPNKEVITNQHSVLAMVTAMDVMNYPEAHIPNESVIGRAFVAAFIHKWLIEMGFAKIHHPTTKEDIVRNITKVSSALANDALPVGHVSKPITVDVLRAAMMVQMCGSKNSDPLHPLANFDDAVCKGPLEVVEIPSSVLTNLETLLESRGHVALFECLMKRPKATE